MLKEACVENFYNIPHVIKAGADRLELNNDLALGGTTPSYGVIKKSVTYAENFKIPVVIMIRPRGGDFVYSENEIGIMADDIEASAKLGAQGVAFGCLTNNNQINRIQIKHLITLARSLNVEVVMHMAFDDISNDKQKTELNWLTDQGVKRILTHGGKLDKPILATILHLKEIIKWANDRIEILPGGGITTENRDDIAKKLQLNELHGSKIV